MNIKKMLGITLLCSLSPFAVAAPSINDMQGCQALIDFVEFKVDETQSVYPASDLHKVRVGIQAYDRYIQNTVVTPGLLQFNGGDKAKAAAMQQQVDAYKASVTASYKKRYPQKKMFADYAVGLNNCAKKAVPAGADLQSLKVALETILKLAK